MNIALIVAGGKGERIKNSLPKQFIEINHKPIFVHAIEAFNIEKVDEIYLVMNEDYINLAQDIVNKYHIDKFKGIIKGGKSRSESVFNGVDYLIKKHADDDFILIHDAARIFIDKEAIEENIKMIKDFDGVATATKATDTLIKIDDNKISKLNRESIYQMQTPQTFSLRVLKEMQNYIKEAEKEYTDEISILIDMNKKIGLVDGGKKNYKITFKEDIEYAEYLLKNK